MIEIDIIIHHDWESKNSKAISAELLLDSLNFVKGSLYHLQREHVEQIAPVVPDEFRDIFYKFDDFNPGYRIVFTSVERGSAKAKGIVVGGLMTWTATFGGHAAWDAFKDTNTYQDVVKPKIEQTVDQTANRLGFHLKEGSEILNNQAERQCWISVERSGPSAFKIDVKPKAIIDNLAPVK